MVIIPCFCPSVRSIQKNFRQLTRYIQRLRFLTFANIIVNLAFDDRVVEIARGVVNYHFRGVVPDNRLLIDVPPAREYIKT